MRPGADGRGLSEPQEGWFQVTAAPPSASIFRGLIEYYDCIECNRTKGNSWSLLMVRER
jgi:hypothetical protein